MPLELENIAPKENPWFSLNVEYNGMGRADFANDRGAAEGTVNVVCDECGSVSARMEVERLIGRDSQPKEILELMATWISRESGGDVAAGFGFGSRPNPCTRLAIDTGSGTFDAVSPTKYDLSPGVDEDSRQIMFRPRVSEFRCTGAGKAKYWVLPLLNFVSEFCNSSPEVSNHPLRISPPPAIPEGLSRDEFLKAAFHANSQNRVIKFEFKGLPAFIEPLPDYANREARLKAGEAVRLVTAVMVGEVACNSTDRKNLRGWFPFHLLTALGFVTGTEVGAPWLEFRDEYGRLVHRVHEVYGGANFTEGHRIIDEWLHRGTGRLLTCFLASWNPHEACLPIAMRHAMKGWRSSVSSIEERVVYVVRGLECLCKHFRPSEPELKARLTPKKHRQVKGILDAAAQRINLLRYSPATADDENEVVALGEIAKRVLTTAWGRSGDFGLKLIDLLTKYRIEDAAVLDAHFARTAPPGVLPDSFASRASRLRAAPIHDGYFEFESGGFQIDDLYDLTRHLHDLLVRLILKIIEYDGLYQPTVIVGNAMQPVDWVQPSTKACELGYP